MSHWGQYTGENSVPTPQPPRAQKFSILIFSGKVVGKSSRLRKTNMTVFVNLASRPPKFLGFASSDLEGLGSQYGANFSKRLKNIPVSLERYVEIIITLE